MNCKLFLRKLGLWPSRRQATQDQMSSALTENARRENDKAFEEIRDVYERQLPEIQEKLRHSLHKISSSPFIDLENLMKDNARRKREHGL